MSNLITKQNIESLVLESISDKDLFLVEVSISASNVIQVSIDGDLGVGIDTCVSISRFIESKLDREAEDFELTVMSAGLSEPFKVYRQYLKNVGKQVSIVASDGKKYIGELLTVNPDGVVVKYEETVKMGPKGKKKQVEIEKEFAFSEIKKTLLEISFKK